MRFTCICIFLFFIFLFPILSYSQSNFKPGYVITLKHDTLRGFIDCREWERNPKNIQFKKNSNDTKIEDITAANSSGFGVTGDGFYERYVVSVSQDTVDVAGLRSNLVVNNIMDTVFLKAINRGRYLTLFAYTDNIKSRYYLLESGESQPQELSYHAFYNPEESTAVKYVYRYRTQLLYLAQKYNTGATGKTIAQANYTESDLLRIVGNINGDSVSQFISKKLSGRRWFAGIGANYANFHLNSGNGYADESGEVHNRVGSLFPKIDIGRDFLINKTTQGLIFRAELSFTANNYSISYQYNLNFVPLVSTLNFKQYNNSLTPQVIYNIYNKENLKIFVDAGISLNVSLYNHYQFITKYPGTSFPIKAKDNYPVLDKFWTSFPLKAGISLNKKIEINVCYVPLSYIINDNSGFSGDIISYQVGINYLFGSK